MTRSAAMFSGRLPSGLGGLGTVRWLTLKIRQRLDARYHAWRVRTADREGSVPEGLRCTFLPWSGLAALPGNPARLAEIWEGGDPSSPHAAEVLAHRFRILSPTFQCVEIDDPDRVAEVLEMARELPSSVVAGYRPIDWHSDFHSGYRWDPAEFYLDVAVGPGPGADIKTPRELSRFQHLGALAGGETEECGEEFLLQVLDWIAANPPRRGVNWACTMDIALRAVSWIWGLRLFESVVERYPDIQRTIAESLHVHGRHIADNLEYYADSTSNHYLADIAGLLYVGAAFPDFPESDAWLAFGLQELVSEMGRQVYPDGVDHEASTHYHRLVGDIFVSCAALAERIPEARKARLRTLNYGQGRFRPALRPLMESGIHLEAGTQLLPQSFVERLTRMAEYTLTLTKPNGLVPQFGDNDSARVQRVSEPEPDIRDHAHLPASVGVLIDREDLLPINQRGMADALIVAGDLRGRLSAQVPPVDPPRPRLFPHGGVAVHAVDEAWLAVTCGPNGQGGRGGHGHNDKNGFELCVGGEDVVVDGGCVAYTSFPDTRNWFRSTQVHSTISVIDAEQDEWPEGSAGLFRLPEKSEPKLLVQDDDVIVGRHSGYGSVHERRFCLRSGWLGIEDLLESARPRQIVFNLDPGITVQLGGSRKRVRAELVTSEGRHLSLEIEGADDPRLKPGAFGVGYGEPVQNLRLIADIQAVRVKTTLRWSP